MIDFTKIKWAGTDHILVTIREHAREPLLILDERDIKNLLGEWHGEKDWHDRVKATIAPGAGNEPRKLKKELGLEGMENKIFTH